MFTKQNRKRWMIAGGAGSVGVACLCLLSVWFLFLGGNEIFSRVARPPAPPPQPKVAISAQNAGKLELLYQIPVTDWVYRMAWSPDSRWLAIDTERFGMPFHSSLYLWDVAKGNGRALYASLEHGIGLLSQVAFLPDGQTLAYRIGASIRYWDVPHDRELRMQEYASRDDVNAAFFQTATGRKFPDMFKVADAEDLFKGDEKDPDNFVFSPDGKLVMAYRNPAKKDSEHKSSLRDVISGQAVQTITGSPPGVFSHNGRIIVSLEKFEDEHLVWYLVPFHESLILSDVESGQVLQPLDGVVRALPRSSIAFSPDDSLVASPAESSEWVNLHLARGQCYVWDTHSGKRYELSGAYGNGGSVAFSPDGRFLAIGWDDGTVQLWGIKP